MGFTQRDDRFGHKRQRIRPKDGKELEQGGGKVCIDHRNTEAGCVARGSKSAIRCKLRGCLPVEGERTRCEYCFFLERHIRIGGLVVQLRLCNVFLYESTLHSVVLRPPFPCTKVEVPAKLGSVYFRKEMSTTACQPYSTGDLAKVLFRRSGLRRPYFQDPYSHRSSPVMAVAVMDIPSPHKTSKSIIGCVPNPGPHMVKQTSIFNLRVPSTDRSYPGG